MACRRRNRRRFASSARYNQAFSSGDMRRLSHRAQVATSMEPLPVRVGVVCDRRGGRSPTADDRTASGIPAVNESAQRLRCKADPVVEQREDEIGVIGGECDDLDAAMRLVARQDRARSSRRLVVRNIGRSAARRRSRIGRRGFRMNRTIRCARRRDPRRTTEGRPRGGVGTVVIDLDPAGPSGSAASSPARVVAVTANRSRARAMGTGARRAVARPRRMRRRRHERLRAVRRLRPRVDVGRLGPAGRARGWQAASGLPLEQFRIAVAEPARHRVRPVPVDDAGPHLTGVESSRIVEDACDRDRQRVGPRSSAISPNRPSWPTISSTPPDGVAATGSPAASASAATTPKVSVGLGWTKTVARAIAATTAGREACPSNATASSDAEVARQRPQPRAPRSPTAHGRSGAAAGRDVTHVGARMWPAARRCPCSPCGHRPTAASPASRPTVSATREGIDVHDVRHDADARRIDLEHGREPVAERHG